MVAVVNKLARYIRLFLSHYVKYYITIISC